MSLFLIKSSINLPLEVLTSLVAPLNFPSSKTDTRLQKLEKEEDQNTAVENVKKVRESEVIMNGKEKEEVHDA